ncbi:F-box/LRR-repeat protein 12-like isoform X2 [Xiphias gladius]|uniref:F-box/LRR-repeat protein 12-like isoform X2 n=1 Tax=Xiphias gladius TaxID=8245 RepID=UPI001A98575B|nr:F-box/LRR-repeat protein 12-like isoform X2 [Xiphias gladius]
MEEFKTCNLDYFPENILIDVLSFLSVRELVRAGRVCTRWKRLVKDQRLWRLVDLTAWKGVLELCGCELPHGFFNQTLPTTPAQERAEATSSVGSQPQRKDQKGKKLSSPSGIPIETLVLNNVPSFTDQHLQSLTSWERLSRLELRDNFRITANGLRSCAAKDGISGLEGLSRLKLLEIGITGRQGYQLQMASLGLGAGWLGLEELSLGGKEVGPGLLCASRLKDLKRLCLWACTLSEMQIVRSCRMLRGLRQLEFLDVIFQPRQCPPVVEGEGAGEEERDSEEAAGGDSSNDENKTLDLNDPIPSLRRSLAVLLPSCTLVFTNCSVQINTD